MRVTPISRFVPLLIAAALSVCGASLTAQSAEEEARAIADFESAAELDGLTSEANTSLSISTEQAAHGKSSLKMVLPAGPYPGVYFAKSPRDWSGYGGLAFELNVPDKTTLGVRVDDENSTGYETRFNMDNLPLRPGWNSVFVPLRKIAQKIDLQRVRAFVLFLLDVKQTTTVYLDHVRLLRVSDRLINGFETEADLKNVSSEVKAGMSLSAEQHTQGGKALKLALPPGPYPGVFVPVPPDWRGQEALKFDLWCQRNSFLGIRLDDQHSTDYNTRFNQDSGVVREGWNRVQVSLDEVAKSINLGEVKALIVFLQNVAEPTTIYLDNVRLGAFDEGLDDRPVPGELGAKKEFKWSSEVVTPHVPWARPLAGGKIKALLVPGIYAGREAIELLQRLDLDAEIVTVEKTWDVNRWGMGDYYGDRGDRGDFRLQYRYLQQAVTSDKQYDVIVLPLVHGWNALTPKTRQALKQRVRNGTGLVLIHPYIGREGTDTSIWELSPLTGCPDDYMPEDGYVRIPPGALTGGHPVWRAAGEHFITKGIPLNLLPFGNMELYKYVARGTTILESEAGAVAAVKEFGKGRVVAFAYRNCDLLPELEGEGYPAWDYWEYLYSLMGRAIVWAAHRDQPVLQGISLREDRRAVSVTRRPGVSETDLTLSMTLKNEQGQVKRSDTVRMPRSATNVTIPLPSPDELDGGRHIVDVLAKTDKGVMDWMSTSYDLPKPFTLQSLNVPGQPVRQGEPIKGGVLIQQAATPPLATGQTQITLDLVDDEDRIIARESFEFKADMAGKQWKEFALQTDRALTVSARVVASVKAGDRLVDRRESRALVLTPKERQPEGLNFHAFMSGVNTGNFPYLTGVYRQRLRDMGSEAGMTFGGVPNSLGVNGMGVYAYDAGPYRERKRQYQATKDKQFLLRQPCLNSTEWRKETRARVLANARSAAPYNPFSYYVNDEGSLTSYTDAFDLCFGPECLAKLRTWLQIVYPSLDALNEKWQTKFSRWEEVMPMTTEEVKAHVQQLTARKHAPSYAAWADHRTFMEVTYADAYRYILGCLRVVDPQGELRISGTQATTAYDGCDWSRITEFVRDTGPYTTGDQWDLHRSFLLNGEKPDGRSGGWTGYGGSGAGVQHFIWNGLFRRIGYMNIFWQYSCLNPDLTFSQSAKDMAVAFKELNGGLGMLLNHARREPATVAVHYSLASCHGATVTGHEEDWNAARRNAIALLSDLGWQFNFVSSQQLDANVLSRRGYKALVLPWSVALSDREVTLIKQFLEAGGAVIAWRPVGSMDEHCAERTAQSLTELTALSAKEGATVQKLGKGRIVVIPSSIKDYGQDPFNSGCSQLRSVLTRELAAVEKEMPCHVFDAKRQPLLQCQRTYFRDGDSTYIGLLRDNLSGQRVVGPDGVEYVKDTGAKTGPEPIVVRLRKPAHVYDVRLGKYLGRTDRVETTLAPAEAKVFALMPDRVTKVTLEIPQATRPGSTVTAKVDFQREGAQKPSTSTATERVLRVEVLNPKGALHPLYSRSFIAATRPVAFALPLALNEATGQWTLRVTDLASGATGMATFRVQ